MDQEKVFGEALERIEAFFHYKNIDFQNSPNLHFCYGVSLWICQKMKIVILFF